MKEFSVSIKDKLLKLDLIVIICCALMSIMSILVLYGGAEAFSGGTQKVIVQCAAFIIGLAVMIVFALLDYDEVITKFEYALFFISIGLLLFTFVYNRFGPHASDAETNANWIKIPGLPVYIQPAEFVKIMFILTFSRHVARLRPEINKIKNVLFLMIHAGIILGLVLLTGDLGTALVFMVIIAFILFSAGLSLWYFLFFAVVAVIISPILWEHMADYQKLRIMAGFNPMIDPENYGYQALMSKKAIIAGGFRGAGLFGGTQYVKVPAAHSDFLFCVLAEKFGFIGTFSYIVLMAVLVVRIIIISRNTRKDYASFICIGVTAILIAQTIENIGMCMGILPVIGITLPFFSYGGSSMVSTFICIGIIQSICVHNQKYFFERESTHTSKKQLM